MQAHFRDLGHAGSKMLEAFIIALVCNSTRTAALPQHRATYPASMVVNNRNGGKSIRKKHTRT